MRVRDPDGDAWSIRRLVGSDPDSLLIAIDATNELPHDERSRARLEQARHGGLASYAFGAEVLVHFAVLFRYVLGLPFRLVLRALTGRPWTVMVSLNGHPYHHEKADGWFGSGSLKRELAEQIQRGEYPDRNVPVEQYPIR